MVVKHQNCTVTYSVTYYQLLLPAQIAVQPAGEKTDSFLPRPSPAPSETASWGTTTSLEPTGTSPSHPFGNDAPLKDAVRRRGGAGGQPSADIVAELTAGKKASPVGSPRAARGADVDHRDASGSQRGFDIGAVDDMPMALLGAVSAPPPLPAIEEGSEDRVPSLASRKQLAAQRQPSAGQSGGQEHRGMLPERPPPFPASLPLPRTIKPHGPRGAAENAAFAAGAPSPQAQQPQQLHQSQQRQQQPQAPADCAAYPYGELLGGCGGAQSVKAPTMANVSAVATTAHHLDGANQLAAGASDIPVGAAAPPRVPIDPPATAVILPLEQEKTSAASGTFAGASQQFRRRAWLALGDAAERSWLAAAVVAPPLLSAVFSSWVAEQAYMWSV